MTTQDVWKDLHERLFSFIRSRVGTDHDAEDILQDVFTRIHAKLGSLTDSKSVTAWVYRITRNAITDFYRARSKMERASGSLAKADEGAGDGDESEPRAELSRCIKPLLKQLPEPYREAVAMTELGDTTQKEAARLLGLSVSGMKARVQRGRRKLKDNLLDCCHVELDRHRDVIGYRERNDGSCTKCECD